ncbi:MAG: hypothetical protein QXM87_06490 [Candidatus Bathyarchaeia archaeon]
MFYKRKETSTGMHMGKVIPLGFGVPSLHVSPITLVYIRRTLSRNCLKRNWRDYYTMWLCMWSILSS